MGVEAGEELLREEIVDLVLEPDRGPGFGTNHFHRTE